MVRPRKPRFVEGEPDTTYFKPRGVPISDLEEINLSVEELEAVRLADVLGLTQEEAAERMEVSRATFQRIVSGARKKVASALVNGKALGIEGGDYVTAGPARDLECAACGYTWSVPFGTGVRACEIPCPDCGGLTAVRVGGGMGKAGRGRRSRRGPR